MCFLGGSVVENLPANSGDADSIPESGISPGEENGNPLQFSCLENSMGTGSCRATVQWSRKRVGHDLATKQLQQQLSMYFK